MLRDDYDSGAGPGDGYAGIWMEEAARLAGHMRRERRRLPRSR